MSGALTVGGGFAVAGALREEMRFGEAVAQTANAAFVEGDPNRTRAKADPAMIAALATHVQMGTNISKVDAVQALHKYVNLASDLTGMSEINPETGRSNLEEMGRISKGSGAAFGDLMTAAGYLKAQNPAMTSADLNLRMRQMVGAGAKGDIAISDMAKYANLATANAGQFAGDLGENQAKMLGLTQIAGRVADPAEAAESVNKLAFDVSKHADKMAAAGIKVTNKAGKILDPADLIGNLFQATGGNIGKLSDLGIEARSARVFEGLQRNYDEAEAVKKGTGAAAVRREVADYEHINFSQGAADTNFQNVMSTDTERLSGALLHFEEVVAHAALPAFEKFVDSLSSHQSDIDAIITGLGKFATALIEHPIGSILAAIAANVGKDVAAAAIGKAIQDKITSMLGSAMGGPAGVPVPKVLGGGTTGLLAAAGAAAIVAGVTYETASAASAGEEQGKAKVNDLLGKLHAAEAGVKAGTTSPQEADAVRRQVKAALSKAQDDTGIAGNALDLASVPLSIAPGSVGQQARADIANVHSQDEVIKGQAALLRGIEALTRAINGGGNQPPVERPSRSHPTGKIPDAVLGWVR